MGLDGGNHGSCLQKRQFAKKNAGSGMFEGHWAGKVGCPRV